MSQMMMYVAVLLLMMLWSLFWAWPVKLLWNWLIPAIFATADRVLRDSKIGTYDVRIDAEHPVVNEGPEAYAPGRAGK